MLDKDAVVLAWYVSSHWVVLLGAVHVVSVCPPLSVITLCSLSGWNVQ